MSTPGGDVIGTAEIQVEADTDPALRAIRRFARSAEQDIGQVGSAARRAAPSLRTLGIALGAAAAPNALASVVAAVSQIGPAAAVGVAGLLAIKQATATVQLGLVGVEDAITAVFDTSEKGAEKLDKALKNLAPNARAFVGVIREARPALVAFQQGIQERLFAGFADSARVLSREVLPVIQENLFLTADILNQLGQNAAGAAAQIAADGTLGRALGGANAALSQLSALPGRIITGLFQIGAAGGPALTRLTAAADQVTKAFSDKLSKAFKSEELTKAIDRAVDTLFQLGRIAGNVFGTFSNVANVASQQGRSLFDTLEQVTGALRDATASKGFQQALGALASVASELAAQAGPVLLEVFRTLGPIFTALGPPVQSLIRVLGDQLVKTLHDLSPLFTSIASAVGGLTAILGPFLSIGFTLIRSVLPLLAPFFDLLGKVLQSAAPYAQQIANIFESVMVPVFQTLVPLVKIFLIPITAIATRIFPLLSQVLVAVAPLFAQLGQAFTELGAALGPLVTELTRLFTDAFGKANSGAAPLIAVIVRMIGIFTLFAVGVIRNILIPAIQFFTTALRDPSQALVTLQLAAARVISSVIQYFNSLVVRAGVAISNLRVSLVTRASGALNSFAQRVSQGVSEAISFLAGLPGRAASALAGLGGLLYSSGRDLIGGFVDGILDSIGEATSAAARVAQSVLDYFPHSPAKEGPFSGRGYPLYSGREVADSFARGMLQGQDTVTLAANEMIGGAGAVPATATAGAGTTVLNLSVTNHGVIASEQEALDWLTKALDNLRRQSRLPRVA